MQPVANFNFPTLYEQQRFVSMYTPDNVRAWASYFIAWFQELLKLIWSVTLLSDGRRLVNGIWYRNYDSLPIE